MEVVKFCGGTLLIAAMLAFPETALNAAREAMHAWVYSVAPALFPFMALMPAVTASAQVWQRLLGRWMRPLLNLPGSAAPALAAGMLAGSPAGAIAAVCCPGLTRSELERLVCCASGLSPAFLITGVGASMLGSPGDGYILMRAQLLSQLTMLLLTRGVRPDVPVQPAVCGEEESPVRAAVGNVLAVCGYMVIFSVAANLIARALGSSAAGLAALCLLDMPSGARALSALPMERTPQILMMSAVTGLGGMCIAAQNLAVCRKYGVRTGKFLTARLSHAALCTAFSALQLRFSGSAQGKSLPPLEFSALISAFFVVPALISQKKDLFLNKRNSAKSREFPPEKREKPQYAVGK